MVSHRTSIKHWLQCPKQALLGKNS